MTLYEFNILDHNSKLKVVWDKGIFLENHISNFERVNCYAIDKFFVEVVYDPGKNVITEVRSFKTGHRLNKYSPKF